MFGHQDDNTAPQGTTAPQTPDTLNDGGAAGIQGTPQPATQPSDDNASDYIMTDAPGAPATSGESEQAGDVSGGTPGIGSDDLLNIKQQALQQLSPLVGHLEQTPEEEFRTTMMMIQAADDQSLVQKAYDAAQKITDEKAKAQALLDIVNEINYFTQHKDGSQ